MTVLFNSARPLYRCENLTAVWNAYHGDKIFKQGGYVDLRKYDDDDYHVVVTDEFVRNKRTGQKVIMIAHGLTGGKLYGADQPQGQFKPEHCKLINYYITSSEYGREFAASAAGIPIKQCLALGMPRTDNYVNTKKGDGKTFLSQYKRVYLYLPTFRAKYNQPTPQINYEYLNSLLEEDELFVIKRHMIRKKKLLPKSFSNVCEIDSIETTTPYLLDCDVVVTDFSSSMFDAYVLNKPVVLTADEKDDYLISRGMYMKYPYEYSSKAIAVEGNEDKLIELLREAYEDGMTKIELTCRERVASACDGHSAERVVALIEKSL